MRPVASTATAVKMAGTIASTHTAKTWATLVKARLSALVVASSGAGFALAGAPYQVDKALAVTVGTALAAASANVLNQVYERRTDALMRRTASRPLPAGEVLPGAAVGAAGALGAASAVMLGIGANPLTAVLGMANIGLYAGIYTPLKQSTTWNTWVGAVVGAVPPLMGYAAATGTILAIPPLLLGSTVFFWQFPHFMSLSWLLRHDYARGGHKMIACADPGGHETGRIMVQYAAVNSVIPFVAYGTGVTSFMFPLEASVLNAGLLWACYRFRRDTKDEHARVVRRASLMYLPLVMASMVLHSRADRREMVEDVPHLTAWPQTWLDRARLAARDACPHEWASLRAKLVPATTASPPDRPFCPSTALDSVASDARLGAAVVAGVAASSSASSEAATSASPR